MRRQNQITQIYFGSSPITANKTFIVMKNTTDQKPTAAAMKAASEVLNSGVPNNVEVLAALIDEATGLPEILPSYTKAINELERMTDFIGYMPRDPEKMINGIMGIVVEARAILAKHTA
jgi:hypothetical protein